MLQVCASTLTTRSIYTRTKKIGKAVTKLRNYGYKLPCQRTKKIIITKCNTESESIQPSNRPVLADTYSETRLPSGAPPKSNSKTLTTGLRRGGGAAPR